MALGDDQPRGGAARFDKDSLPHQIKLIDEVERTARANGLKDGIRPALKAAMLHSPRHHFVGDYQPFFGGPVQNPGLGDLKDQFPLIYSDLALGYVDSRGMVLPSSNSGPSAILHVLELLDLQPGQKVLEIGSGRGWLLSLIAHAIGGRGHAIGIEVIPELAAHSRAAFSQLGIANALVISGDGAKGAGSLGPYDRVIFTTGMWSLPDPYFDQVKPGGLLIAPFHIKGLGNEVLVLRRDDGDGFTVEASLPMTFVEPSGSLANDAPAPKPIEEFGLFAELANKVLFSAPMTFGDSGLGGINLMFGWRTFAFRSFLTKTEPRFQAICGQPTGPLAALGAHGDIGAAAMVTGIAIVDERRKSMAICDGHTLTGYGDATAARAFLSAYRQWTELLMGAADAFNGRLTRRRDAPSPGPGEWLEDRGDSTFLWSVRPDWPLASQLSGDYK